MCPHAVTDGAWSADSGRLEALLKLYAAIRRSHATNRSSCSHLPNFFSSVPEFLQKAQTVVGIGVRSARNREQSPGPMVSELRCKRHRKTMQGIELRADEQRSGPFRRGHECRQADRCRFSGLRAASERPRIRMTLWPIRTPSRTQTVLCLRSDATPVRLLGSRPRFSRGTLTCMPPAYRHSLVNFQAFRSRISALTHAVQTIMVSDAPSHSAPESTNLPTILQHHTAASLHFESLNGFTKPSQIRSSTVETPPLALLTSSLTTKFRVRPNHRSKLWCGQRMNDCV